MTDNELVNEMVEQAYGRLADGHGKLEAGDKGIIVLERNNNQTLELIATVEKLIRKVSCSNGKPITVVDRAKAAMSTVAVSGATVAVLLTILALWDQVRPL